MRKMTLVVAALCALAACEEKQEPKKEAPTATAAATAQKSAAATATAGKTAAATATATAAATAAVSSAASIGEITLTSKKGGGSGSFKVYGVTCARGKKDLTIDIVGDCPAWSGKKMVDDGKADVDEVKKACKDYKLIDIKFTAPPTKAGLFSDVKKMAIVVSGDPKTAMTIVDIKKDKGVKLDKVSDKELEGSIDVEDKAGDAIKGPFKCNVVKGDDDDDGD